MKEKLKKYDRPMYGVIIGLIFPIIGFLISYPILTRGYSYEEMDFQRYINYTIHGIDRQTILIFCMLPNMFLFYFSNFRLNMIEFTKGLVAMTLLLGIMLIILTLT
ncbi:MAG: hypothetical protein IT222_00630 [Crocinitomix sp.]|nr:hypothetical protein [Crocinitomix sp.]